MDERWMVTKSFRALAFPLRQVFPFASFYIHDNRWVYMMLSMFTARCKYYTIWIMAEGACVLAGIGYNGVNPITHQPQYNRVSNVLVWEIETAESPKTYLDAWNTCTNRWLRYHVYMRLVHRGQRPGLWPTIATFLTSAFWHGIFPGYYFMFLYAAFAVNAARKLRKSLHPWRQHFAAHDSKWAHVYDILGWFLTQSVISYAAVSFMLLNFSDTVQAQRNLRFIAWVAVILVEIFFAAGGATLIPKVRLEKSDAKKNALEEPVVVSNETRIHQD